MYKDTKAFLLPKSIVAPKGRSAAMLSVLAIAHIGSTRPSLSGFYMNKDTNKIKYFAYVRKSTEGEERQALSIPAQKDKLNEVFGKLDIEFVEDKASAFKPFNRPAFADMLERIKAASGPDWLRGIQTVSRATRKTLAKLPICYALGI